MNLDNARFKDVDRELGVALEGQRVDSLRRQLLSTALLTPVAAALTACGGGSSDSMDPLPPTRTWKMGFFPTGARQTAQSVIQGIDSLATRAELVQIHELHNSLGCRPTRTLAIPSRQIFPSTTTVGCSPVEAFPRW